MDITPTSGDDRPKVGQTRSVSLWFSGDEQKRKAEITLRAALKSDELKTGIVLSTIEFETVNADDPRLEGRRPPESGAQCLVARAVVVDYSHMTQEDAGFIANLDPKDLDALRAATRKAFKKPNPKGFITQDKIDTMIARIAPETVARLIRH